MTGKALLAFSMVSGLAGLWHPGAARAEGAADLYNVGNQKQLLFDDAFFESHRGFWWRVCPPKKTGERTLVADRPWESHRLDAWPQVMEDGGRYRMWYMACPSPTKAYFCYAESKDGIHWDKPALGLESFGGSKENNILFEKLNDKFTGGSAPFKDPTAPPKERYKLFHQVGTTIWGAVSPDGIRWKACEKPLMTGLPGTTRCVCFWDARLKRYVGYVRLQTPDRSIGRSETADSSKFPFATEILRCDNKDPWNTDMYNSAAIKYPYAENAYFMFISTYYHRVNNLDVQLAASRDGVRWSRVERKPFIPNGEPGSIDDAMIYCGTGVLRMGNELSMYYGASRQKHEKVDAKWRSAKDMVYTRAVLPLDRYVAMDAGLQPAEFTTHPLTFSGDRLEINAYVRPKGFMKMELRDAEGEPIPGFALDDCHSLAGDSLRHIVSWKNGSDVSGQAGKPTRIHCVMRDASAYAFHFVKEPATESK